MNIILLTALIAFSLAFILGTALGFFKQIFAVPEDPMVGRITKILPGVNCGACGYSGCENFAEAISAGTAQPNACTIGGTELVEYISKITGLESGKVVENVVILSCQGSSTIAPKKGNYTGLYSCRAAMQTGGVNLCSWSCQGFGDCIKVCKFNAMKMGKHGLPVIDYEKCTGCKLCTNECPQGLLKTVPRDQKGALVLCANKNPIKQMILKTCKRACIKCGLCVKTCPEQCISLKNYLPVVELEKCTSCGICAVKCPTKVFKIIMRNEEYFISFRTPQY